MFWTLISTLFAGLLGLGVYIYYLQKGQFDDFEDVKFEIFRNEEED